MKNNLDEILEKLGIKYIYLIYDFNFKEQISHGLESDYLPFFCEISWGSGDDDYPVEFAINDNGKTPGEALQKCIDYFFTLIKRGYEPAVEIANVYNIKTPTEK